MDCSNDAFVGLAALLALFEAFGGTLGSAAGRFRGAPGGSCAFRRAQFDPKDAIGWLRRLGRGPGCHTQTFEP